MCASYYLSVRNCKKKKTTLKKLNVMFSVQSNIDVDVDVGIVVVT